ISRVSRKSQPSRLGQLELVLVTDRDDRREIRSRAGPVRDCSQRTHLEHADEHHEQKGQHHDRGQGSSPTIVVHWLISPRATAVDRTAMVVVQMKGIATCSSVRRDTRTGSRQAIFEGSISTMTRLGSMPTRRNCSWM